MSSPSPSQQAVPSALVTERKEGWSAFTRATFISCVAVAVLLVLMLVFLRLL